MATTLDLDQINSLMQDARTRGDYLRVVSDFFKSGELAIDVSEKFPGKKANSLANSVKQNIAKIADRPNWKVIQAGGNNGNEPHIVLINMDVYHLQSQNDEA